MNKLYALLMALFIFIPTPSRSQSSDVPGSSSRVIDITGQIEAMIEAGYHKVTNNGRGMEAEEYRVLWGKTVVQPPEYVGRFDTVLLVDRTINPIWLIQFNAPNMTGWDGLPYSRQFSFLRGQLYQGCNAYCDSDPCAVEIGNFCRQFRDVVAAPQGSNNQSLTRYVIFLQTGKINFGKSVKEARKTFTPDEIGLTAIEGLYLPTQYLPQTVTNDCGYQTIPEVALAGTEVVGSATPVIQWFSDGSRQAYLHYDYASWKSYKYSGAASRGEKVISITSLPKVSLSK